MLGYGSRCYKDNVVNYGSHIGPIQLELVESQYCERDPYREEAFS